MSCITKVSYNVIINGSASPFFHAEHGLQQGCPLSPLLFLLIMEGLSLLIVEERRVGRLQGIKITNDCILTHLLFVNDVLIFLNGDGDSSAFLSLLQLFCRATSMECNARKSTISSTGCSPHEIQYAHQRFPFTLLPLDDGLKYVGFRLKPLH